MTLDLINAINALNQLFPMLSQIQPHAQGSPPAGRPEFLSKRDAATMLGVSIRTVERYIEEGKLQKRHVGKRVRVSRWEVELLVK
jgi:excisionase family DNA binding protein